MSRPAPKKVTKKKKEKFFFLLSGAECFVPLDKKNLVGFFGTFLGAGRDVCSILPAFEFAIRDLIANR
jgi:hypothetical protein